MLLAGKARTPCWSHSHGILRAVGGVRICCFTSPGSNNACVNYLCRLSHLHGFSLGCGSLVPLLNLLQILLDGWRRSGVRVKGFLCHGGRGEMEDAPLYSTWGQLQTVPEKPSRFLHCFVFHILQAAEWVLQTTWGLCWGGPPAPAPLFFYHPHTYATITIKDNGGYLKLSWEMTWGAGYCWC